MRIIEQIHAPAEGLNALLVKYGPRAQGWTLAQDALTIAGQSIPLFPWRYERRFIEMKKMLEDGTLGALSQVRAVRTGPRAEGLEAALYRELDLCLWWSERPVERVFAVQNGACANVLMRLKGGALCIVEAAAQLADGVRPQERHELITDRGMATDQAIDAQLMQESVYAFVQDAPAAAYTDVDFELFGLSADQVALVRAAHAALSDPQGAQRARAQKARVQAILAAVYESARTAQEIAPREG